MLGIGAIYVFTVLVNLQWHRKKGQMIKLCPWVDIPPVCLECLAGCVDEAGGSGQRLSVSSLQRKGP